MRPQHLITLLALLALTTPAAPVVPAHAGGIVSVCDEAHLTAALAGGGIVTFTCSGVILLTSTIEISANTTIDGSGQNVTISGSRTVGVFIVGLGATLHLNALTIADGLASNGGGILNSGVLTVRDSTFSGNSAAYGGGIYNILGTVTVRDSTFSGNSATSGGGIINSAGKLTVRDSTFSGNSAADGGGIYAYNPSELTVSNSMFSGNSATNNGGGIYYHVDSGSGTVTVTNSTFSGNSAIHGGGGGIYDLSVSGELAVTNSTFSGNSASYGGGIYKNKNSTTTLKNTIVANSPAGGNCSGTIIDGSGNLSYPDATCPGINSDPMLGPLQDNGGPTQTMALLPGSAALDAANDAICAAEPVNNLDQRGMSRPQGPRCDIGAFERLLPTDYLYLPIIVR